MSPRPAPDLELRRDRAVTAARAIAESEGWAAVTTRRIAAALGVTQPVLYSAFSGRQAVMDAVALAGFGDLAAALEAVDPTPGARLRAWLDFAAAHPRVYEAMFSLPTGLAFAVDDTPKPMQRAFRAIWGGLPDADETHVEVVWSVFHGLATLEASRRFRPDAADSRLDDALRMLSR